RPMARRSRFSRPIVAPANEETAGRNICGIWKMRLREIRRRLGSYSIRAGAAPGAEADTFDILPPTVERPVHVVSQMFSDPRVMGGPYWRLASNFSPTKNFDEISAARLTYPRSGAQHVTIVTLQPGLVGFHCTRKLVTELACMRRMASNSPLF